MRRSEVHFCPSVIDLSSSVSTEPRLTDRERDILRLVVRSVIETAGPIGSRSLSKRYRAGLSPASIRNTMSDLEEKGYLDHPYTSAGRVPTERGYRAYVDELMETPELTSAEERILRAEVDRLIGNTDEVLRESSRLLGQLSNLLGVVLSPRMSTGVLDRIEVVPLSGDRVMFVLSMRAGLVKTIVLECEVQGSRREIDRVVSILNERLAGLTLREIRETYTDRIKDLRDEQTGIVRLVLDESSSLFNEPENGRVSVGGAQHIMTQPEFQEPEDLRHLISLLENENFVVHLLEEQLPSLRPGEATVRIGREQGVDEVQNYSIVTATYSVDDMQGTIGVLGPIRMDYARAVALVQNMANLMNGLHRLDT